jgi:ketosteroid isomerase-like protein
MKTDEQAIRDLVATWLDATRKGDIATVLTQALSQHDP